MTAAPDLAAWLRETIARRLELHRNCIPGPEALDVIARCEAELAILDLHVPLGDTEPPMCVICLEYVPCRTVRLLGSGYRHRDGYLEDQWKP